MIDPRQNLAGLILEHPELAPVLQRHHLDFCCHGETSLEAACAEQGLALGSLLPELSRAIAERRGAPADDPRVLSTPALIARILSRHHDYLRQALPFVQELAAKVEKVHGEHNPKLLALRPLVDELARALVPHLDEEERTLFPALMARAPDRAALEPRLRAMLEDHLAVGRLLEEIRHAADEFQVPEWGCRSYRTLFAELERLEGDVLEHVHLENHVLAPRFARAAG